MVKHETTALAECDNKSKSVLNFCSQVERVTRVNKSLCLKFLKYRGWRLMKHYSLCPYCSKLKKKYIELKN